MDPVSLLFYWSWLHAIHDEACAKPEDRGLDKGRLDCAMDSGPDWRRVLAPLAVVAAVVLAGSVFPAGT